MVPVFTGAVDSAGTLHLDDRPALSRYLEGLTGRRVEVVVRELRRTRSHRQNRYYWGVVIALLAEHCGYEPEEMHEALKLQFLRVPADEDHPLETVRSTARLKTSEFEVYLEQIRRWAATEMGVYIPEPNEVDAD
jgi:hypothetical protein